MINGYRGVAYLNNEQAMRLFTWDDDGNRIYTDIAYNPYYYVETQKGKHDAMSLYNTHLKKVICRDATTRYRKIEDSLTPRIFGNMSPKQQFLIDQFWEDHEKPEFTRHRLKIHFIDIEVYAPDFFPDPYDALCPVNVITIYDNLSDHYYVWGTAEYDNKADDVTYVHCKTETALLQNFLYFIMQDYPDVISGWNIEGFDIPYLVNRIEKMLGEGHSNKFSPVWEDKFPAVTSRAHFGRFMREEIKYYFDGVSILDYMEVYRTFNQVERASYSLDSIAEVELGENKLVLDDSLANIADKDWQKFVDYNIRDVHLVVKLDVKLQFLALARMLSYVGCTPFELSLGTISTVNGRACIEALQLDPPRIVPTFVKPKDLPGGYVGGYVSDPVPGFHQDIISFDANSLYPSCMMTLNLSPETKVGSIVTRDKDYIYVKLTNGKDFKFTHENFKRWITKEQICVSRADKLFSQKKKGIFPQISDNFYSIRKEHKKQWGDKRTELEKVEREIKQLEKELGRA